MGKYGMFIQNRLDCNYYNVINCILKSSNFVGKLKIINVLVVPQKITRLVGSTKYRSHVK